MALERERDTNHITKQINIYIYIYSINIHHPNKISNWIDFQDDPSRKNSRASNTAAAAAAAVKRDDTGEWNWG